MTGSHTRSTSPVLEALDEALLRLAQDDGRFCLNIPLDKNKDGQQSVGADLTTIAKECGFSYHSTIVWNEGNISRRTAWGSWASASAPFVIAPVELIVVCTGIHGRRPAARGSRTSQNRNSWTGRTGSGHSTASAGQRSATLPPSRSSLPLRCMKLFSFVGDTVLDPFMGSGSTLPRRLAVQPQGLGIEIDPHYCKIAVRRIADEGRGE